MNGFIFWFLVRIRGAFAHCADVVERQMRATTSGNISNQSLRIAADEIPGDAQNMSFRR